MLIKLQEFLILSTFFSEILSYDYCAMEKCPNKHTLCLYPDDKIACEGDGVKGGLTDDLIKTILDCHNDHRKKVARGKESPQPKSSNMMKLVWHEEAAKIAQHWANQCKFNHDDCRDLPDSTVGQNIASHSVSLSSPIIKETIVKMIDLWYAEVKDFEKGEVNNFKSLASKSGKTVGHYTQIVWAETTAIGCGFIELKPENDHYKNTHLICNYVPSGNILSHPIYKIGKACTDCPGGTKCSKSYPGLCTEDKDDFGEVPDDADSSGSTFPKHSHLSYLFYLVFFTLAVNLVTIINLFGVFIIL